MGPADTGFAMGQDPHKWLVTCIHLSPQYLQTLHLQSCDLLDIFGGISFFPLDKMTYLKIQSFINRMEESLSIVKYTAFLYNDQLIWLVPKMLSG